MKNILLSSLVASLLVTGCIANEVAPKNATVKQINTTSINNAKKAATQNQVKVVQEAVDSLKYAHDALVELNKGNKEKASSYLEKALGKLEVTLASKNVPELLPVDSSITIDELVASSDTIKSIVKHAKDLLDDDKVQEAKAILKPLKSEIGITVVSLPLATYPDALKETAKRIHNNKVDEAKVVLGTALNTLVVTETIIPIPLVEATDLIAAASDVAEKDPKQAKLYLDAAQEALKTSKYLGYVSSSDVTYKALDDTIAAIKHDATSAEVKGFFTNLQTKLKDFTSKIFTSKDKSKK
jgi:hypothetical protein